MNFVEEFERLKGKALYTIKPVIVMVYAPYYDIFGDLMELHGGVELRVIDEKFEIIFTPISKTMSEANDNDIDYLTNIINSALVIPCTVHDYYLPKDMTVAVYWSTMDESFVVGEYDNKKKIEYQDCIHGNYHSGCMSCFKKWWQAKL